MIKTNIRERCASFSLVLKLFILVFILVFIIANQRIIGMFAFDGIYRPKTPGQCSS